MRPSLLASGLAAATLCLMTLGSVVHGTGSSLACPDWPLCHGTVFPAMTHGVQFEHSHRLLALVVIALAVALVAQLLRGPDGVARRRSLTVVGLLGVQATLGALTVILRLPPAISIAHLATSMLVLSFATSLAVRLAPHAERAPRPGLRRAPLALAALAYVQIVLGAFVRHGGAGPACLDFPSCYGAYWPETWRGQLHMAHRGLGLALGIAILAVSIALARALRGDRRRHLACLPGLLAVAQASLGIAVVERGLSLALVTAHHATGALVLASLVALAESLGTAEDVRPASNRARVGAAAVGPKAA